MKLEVSLKYFSPQGMYIGDDVKGTSPERLTGTDVMAAIGTTSNRERFGLAAFFGKAGISKTDEQMAVQALFAVQYLSLSTTTTPGTYHSLPFTYIANDWYNFRYLCPFLPV